MGIRIRFPSGNERPQWLFRGLLAAVLVSVFVPLSVWVHRRASAAQHRFRFYEGNLDELYKAQVTWTAVEGWLWCSLGVAVALLAGWQSKRARKPLLWFAALAFLCMVGMTVVSFCLYIYRS